MKIHNLSKENSYDSVCEQLTAAGFEEQTTYWEHEPHAERENVANYFTQLGAPSARRQIWANPENGLIAEISSYPGDVTIHGAIILNERGQNEIYNKSNVFENACQELRDREIFGQEATEEDMDKSPSATFAGSFADQTYSALEGNSVRFKNLDDAQLYEQSGLTKSYFLKAKASHTKTDQQPALTFSINLSGFGTTDPEGKHQYNAIDLERFTKFLSQYGTLTKRNMLEDPHVETFLGGSPSGLDMVHNVEVARIAAWKRYDDLPDSFKDDLGDLPDILTNVYKHTLETYEEYLGCELKLANRLQGVNRI
jgi:hypothetical protein